MDQTQVLQLSNVFSEICSQVTTTGADPAILKRAGSQPRTKRGSNYMSPFKSIDRLKKRGVPTPGTLPWIRHCMKFLKNWFLTNNNESTVFYLYIIVFLRSSYKFQIYLSVSSFFQLFLKQPDLRAIPEKNVWGCWKAVFVSTCHPDNCI